MLKVSAKGVGYLCVFLAAAFWGTEAVIAKLCYITGYNTATMLFFRFFFGAVFFNSVAVFFKQDTKIPREKWPVFSRLIIFQLGSALCLFKAFEFLSPALAIMFYYLFPSLACLIGIVFYKEAVVWTKIISISGAFSGLLLLYGSSMGSIPLKGVGFAVLAAIFQAINYTAMARFLPGISTPAYNCKLNTVMVTIYLSYLLITKSFVFIPTAQGISFIVMLGLFAWIIPIYFFTKGIRQIGSTDASIILFLEAPFTVLLSFIVFKEILTPLQFLGALMIISAVAIPQVKALYLRRKVQMADNIDLNREESISCEESISHYEDKAN